MANVVTANGAVKAGGDMIGNTIINGTVASTLDHLNTVMIKDCNAKAENFAWLYRRYPHDKGIALIKEIIGLIQSLIKNPVNPVDRQHQVLEHCNALTQLTEGKAQAERNRIMVIDYVQEDIIHAYSCMIKLIEALINAGVYK